MAAPRLWSLRAHSLVMNCKRIVVLGQANVAQLWQSCGRDLRPRSNRCARCLIDLVLLDFRFLDKADESGCTASFIPVANDPTETWATNHFCSAKALFIPLRTQRMCPTLGERADVFRSKG